MRQASRTSLIDALISHGWLLQGGKVSLDLGPRRRSALRGPWGQAAAKIHPSRTPGRRRRRLTGRRSTLLLNKIVQMEAVLWQRREWGGGGLYMCQPISCPIGCTRRASCNVTVRPLEVEHTSSHHLGLSSDLSIERKSPSCVKDRARQERTVRKKLQQIMALEGRAEQGGLDSQQLAKLAMRPALQSALLALQVVHLSCIQQAGWCMRKGGGGPASGVSALLSLQVVHLS